MAQSVFTVAILGCGNRGAESYGALLSGMPEKYRIVALCDMSAVKLKKYGERFSVEEALRFESEAEFFLSRRADLLVIGTMDKDHVRQCIKALELGYNVLLEKPIASTRGECEKLLETQKKYGGKVLVCHVLRYAPAFLKVAELIKSGAIGRLVSMQAIEQIMYWHDAHSYVRGNWRRSEDSAPMIIAKCCHDLDLLQFYANSRCKSVSSVGDLTYFTPENAPEGASSRCMECKLLESCPYSAKRIYVDGWRAYGSPDTVFPQNQVTTAYPLTEEALYEALKTGPYGRCVYACDNNVVDHQLTQIEFENGVKATLTMMAFTQDGGRIMRFFGTRGEIVLNEEENYIKIKVFGGPAETVNISALAEGGYAHGGGDNGLVNELYAVLTGNAASATSLEASVESHLMGICAEESRLAGGRLVYVHGQK